ncbi:hypothetical protein CBL_05898 [Carabus blaptoides fortunei]
MSVALVGWEFDTDAGVLCALEFQKQERTNTGDLSFWCYVHVQRYGKCHSTMYESQGIGNLFWHARQLNKRWVHSQLAASAPLTSPGQEWVMNLIPPGCSTHRYIEVKRGSVPPCSACTAAPWCISACAVSETPQLMFHPVKGHSRTLRG